MMSGIGQAIPMSLLLLAALVGCEGGSVSDAGPQSDAALDGGPADAEHDSSIDAAPADAGPCGTCSGSTPHCREGDGQCVACLGDGDCGDERVCDTEAGECVGCLADTDCTDASAARCDGATGSCAACESDIECQAGITGLPVCDAGACIACTPETEAEHCGSKACDPVDFVCTDTDRGTIDTCERCLADSECIPNHRCIPLTYDETPRGHYCMPMVTGGGCGTEDNRPYTVPLTDRASRSGEPIAIYCGINEALTTCEAVLAALGGQGAGCDMDDSRCPEGGRCRTVGPMGAGGSRCTYSCGDPLQCPNPEDIATLATCNTGVGDRYCGRP